MDSGEDKGLVPVYRTADNMLLPLLKSVLDAAGIPYVVQGEGALGLFPLGEFSIGVNRRSLGAIIRVESDRAEEARALLEETAQPDPSAGEPE